MWLAFQTAIICAVIVANFFLHITPIPYLVGVTGVVAAWLATRLVSLFITGAPLEARTERKPRWQARWCPFED